MVRIRPVIGLISAVLLLLACPKQQVPPAAANLPMLVKLPLEELVAQSDCIVVGRVVGKQSRANTDTKHTYTLITLTVEDWIKGEREDNTIVIKLPGGKTGGTTRWIEDAESFQVEEVVVVFLKSQDDGSFNVVGGRQGKLVVEKGSIAGSDLSLEELVSEIMTEVDKASKEK